jgi:DNA-binding SARP family transcriptional activator
MLLALARAGRARTTTAANLARACEAQGRLEEARGHWQRCAELTPLSREAWQQLLRLSESLGDAAGAQTARAALEKL